jgi:hypothetical protein
MFFFGIFGLQSKQKEIRDINNITCKKCGRISAYKLIKSFSYFHIFFIPIFKWGTKYFLVARCCNSVFQISEEKGTFLEKGEDLPINDEDLTLVYNKGYGSEIVCPKCGGIVDSQYSFCPHCGQKL